jgi:glycosyltransferase involved in cell wall biosynthesis
VPARDPEALATAIRSLLDDPARRTELSARGRARVLQRFTYQRMTEATLAAYARFLAEDRE